MDIIMWPSNYITYNPFHSKINVQSMIPSYVFELCIQ